MANKVECNSAIEALVALERKVFLPGTYAVG